jgi:protein-disulfide isomerase
LIFVSAAAAVVVAGVLATVFSSTPTNATELKSGNDVPDPNASRNQEILSQLKTVSLESAPALGSPDAKVTIVEFGDYQCTWCHRWHQSTKDTFLAEYVDTGKVRFLFKDFPINDHSDRASSRAAEASYCAADQGKYWDYHDELYVNWKGENNGWVTGDSLRQFASNIGLDGQRFSDCLDSGRYSGLVRANYNLAVATGLSATPSFIVLVDGETPKLIRGAHPMSTFAQVIDPVYPS